jgi:hypothetical protein
MAVAFFLIYFFTFCFDRISWSHCPIVFEFIIDGAGGVCCTTPDYVPLCKHGARSGEGW